MPTFKDIPHFPRSYYNIDVSLDYVKHTLDRYLRDGLNMDPDFQRGHVWTVEQQEAFMRYMLQGGETTRIYFNCPRFTSGYRPKGKFVCVDGKQRLTAALAFLNDEIRPFGLLCSEYTGRMRPDVGFRFHVAELDSKLEVLQWYLSINSGGTPHSEEDLERVRQLIAKEKVNTK